MPSDPLFAAMFSTPGMTETVSGRSWVRAMLRVEAALARGSARLGLVSTAAADEIAAVCEREDLDPALIGAAATASASPVLPLLDALRSSLSPEAAAALHRGATSQDIVDTAMMLVVRDGLNLVLATVEEVESQCARLAERHRGDLMAGRTLLQQAVPITFGLKAARWLSGFMDARKLLANYRSDRLALQLGGAAGSRVAFGDHAQELARTLARDLDLHDPVLPWHTDRTRIAELSAALGILAGSAGKVALDIILLTQDEVGEVREGGDDRGRSSAMAHKRNPAGSVQVLACARRAQALVPVLLGSMVQEHERAAGAWQAEWETLGDLLSLTHAAVTHLAATLAGLEVDTVRMSANAARLIAGSTTGEDHRRASSALVDGLLADYQQDRTGP